MLRRAESGEVCVGRKTMRIHRYSSAQSNTLFKRISAAFLLASAAAALTHSVAAQADTILGSFTLSNYYTPTSPTNSTPTDPSNPLSATITFTYLKPAAAGGYNLAVQIANTSTPVSNNELIRDVVFQVSDNGNLLTGSPSSSTAYLASYASEDYSGSPSTIAPGGSLSSSWAIDSSASYANSYDLTSQAPSQNRNLDMIGPPLADMGSANQTVGSGSLAPALLPASGNNGVTFDVNIPNLDGAATIQNIYVGYGFTSTLGGYVPLGGYVSIPSSDPPAVVPEPSTAAVAGAMLCLAGLFIRRRRA